MSVYVVPDLALLVCPPDITPHDLTFFDEYWHHFLQHDEMVEANGFCWMVSDELKICLMNTFPWSNLDEVPWLRGFYEEFFLLWSKWHSPDVHIERYPEAQISPNIVPDYVEEATKQAWHDVLTTCGQENHANAQVASHPQQIVSQLRIVPCEEAEEVYILGIVCTIEQWDATLATMNPWVAAHLPQHGDYPYVPPVSWQHGHPFPRSKCSHGNGFLDDQRRIWIWDKAEQHWDVQHYPYKRGAYDRITIDGRMLG